MLLHPLHAFTPDGTPLGTVHALTWVRDEADERCASLSRSRRAATPIEEKESYRWVDALRRSGEEAQRCPSTQLVCMADSEADIYELLAEATTEPRRIDWIIRGLPEPRFAAGKQPGHRGKIRARTGAHAAGVVYAYDPGPRAKGQSQLRDAGAPTTT